MADDLLQKAASLAKAGQRAEAILTLKQYLREQPTDSRAWWALARITDDAETKRKSLERVLKLKPDHDKARDMLSEMDSYNAILEGELETNVFASPTPPPVAQPPKRADGLGGFLQAKVSEGAQAAKPTSPFTGTAQIEKAENAADDDFFSPEAMKRAKEKTRGKTDIYIGAGMIVLACVLVIGAVWYAYNERHLGIFGLFGPDLSKEVSNGDVTIHYPEEWSARALSENNRIYISSHNPQYIEGDFDVTSLASGTIILTDAQTLEFLGMDSLDDLTSYSLISFDKYSTSEFGGLAGSAQLYIDLVANLLELEAENTDSNVEFETNKSDISIDGEDGKFTAIKFGGKTGDIQIDELYISFYFATTRHGSDEYLFTMIAIEEEFGDREQLARRIVRSIEFSN